MKGAAIAVEDTCKDETDSQVKALSQGKLPGCAMAKPMCKHAQHGQNLKRLCPKTCGVCNSPKRHLRDATEVQELGNADIDLGEEMHLEVHETAQMDSFADPLMGVHGALVLSNKECTDKCSAGSE